MRVILFCKRTIDLIAYCSWKILGLKHLFVVFLRAKKAILKCFMDQITQNNTHFKHIFNKFIAKPVVMARYNQIELTWVEIEGTIVQKVAKKKFLRKILWVPARARTRAHSFFSIEIWVRIISFSNSLCIDPNSILKMIETTPNPYLHYLWCYWG